MGAALGCSCETNQEQNEISLMQPNKKLENGGSDAKFSSSVVMGSPNQSDSCVFNDRNNHDNND
jgi:hypothetical protein